jgi:2,4-dienoyl-CoA reductase-like NADH-dependent reductase (Old Yellow Enzyme family)/NADPH-dependent 2,4-dienoyl-CoA reductase/sulfur reductase-like enzyme
MGKMSKELKHLAAPLRMGNIRAKNRLWEAPSWTRMASVDGEVTERLIDHYVARAKGGVGLICTEAVAVDPRHTWIEPQIRIDDNKYLPGLRRLVDAVHRYDVPIVCQLHVAGMFGINPISPSGVPAYDFAQQLIKPSVLSIGEIEEIRDMFIEGAVRAHEVGFDGVELHGGAAYLLEQFFSAHNNRRNDAYGGSLGNRMRLAIEILQGIRKRLGTDYAVGYTNPDTDAIPGGITPEDSLVFAKTMESEGISYWDLVIPGTYETFHLPEIEGVVRKQRRGQWDRAANYKKVLQIPVVARTISSVDPEIWDSMIGQGKLDAVRATRPLFADPNLPNKAFAGKCEDIRKCLTCNECLDAGVAKPYMVQCAVNYGLGRGEAINFAMPPAAVPKKVLVVGGGPGGLEAARVAALRGHKVTLMEKQAHLGGETKIAALTLDKDVLAEFIAWEEKECRKAGVTIELGKEATAAVVEKFGADAVFIATGATPAKPPIPGIDKAHVFTARQVLQREAVFGKKIVIAGAGAVGIDMTEFIIQNKLAEDVTILDQVPMAAFGNGMAGIDRAYYFVNIFPTLGLKAISDSLIEEITDTAVVAVDKKWHKHEIPADTVILALGYTPDNNLYEVLRGKVKELYVIGDAIKSRNILSAVHDGAYFAERI